MAGRREFTLRTLKRGYVAIFYFSLADEKGEQAGFLSPNNFFWFGSENNDALMVDNCGRRDGG